MALGSALNLARRLQGKPSVGRAPLVVASLLINLGALYAPLWPLQLSGIALPLWGVFWPNRLQARAFRRASCGDFEGALRDTQRALRISPQPQWAQLPALWRGLSALWDHHDPQPLEQLKAQLAADAAPIAQALHQSVLQWQRDWPALLTASSPLAIRAQCELGQREVALVRTAELWQTSTTRAAQHEARAASLAPLAFAGETTLLRDLLPLLRLPDPLPRYWQAIAQAAAGQPQGHTQLHTLAERAPSAALAATIRQRAQQPPAPTPLSPVEREAIARIAPEIRAQAALKLRLFGPPFGISAALVILLCVALLAQTLLGGSQDLPTLTRMGALVGGQKQLSWQLLSYGWLHYGELHWLSNVIMLAFIGPLSERLYGQRATLGIWLLSLLGAGLGISFLGHLSLTVGASGGVMGLLSALWVGSLAHPMLRASQAGRRSRWLWLGLIALQLVGDLFSTEVSHAGHLFGFFSGVLLGLVLSLWAQRGVALRAAPLLLLGLSVPLPASAQAPAPEATADTSTQAQRHLNDPLIIHLLEDLAAALRAGQTDRAAELYDWPSLAQQVVQRGGLNPTHYGPDLAQHLAQHVRAEWAQPGAQGGWRQVRIDEAQLQPNGRLRVHVYLSDPDQKRVLLRRYWFQLGAQGPKIVDQESLALGIRLSDVLALHLKAAQAPSPALWLPALQALPLLSLAKTQGQWAFLLSQLSELRRLPAPPPLAQSLALQHARALTRVGEFDAALAVIRAQEIDLQRRQPLPEASLPLDFDRVRAVAQEGLGHCREALKSIEVFLESYPNDATAWALKGLCANRQGQRVRAARALGRALGQESAQIFALGALLIYTPAGEDHLLVHRLQSLDPTQRQELAHWLTARLADAARARLQRLLP